MHTESDDDDDDDEPVRERWDDSDGANQRQPCYSDGSSIQLMLYLSASSVTYVKCEGTEEEYTKSTYVCALSGKLLSISVRFQL